MLPNDPLLEPIYFAVDMSARLFDPEFLDKVYRANARHWYPGL
jgi:hypothetical protein